MSAMRAERTQCSDEDDRVPGKKYPVDQVKQQLRRTPEAKVLRKRVVRGFRSEETHEFDDVGGPTG
jgi:hypothetical protein